jgi:hypothetical protein
MNEEPVTVVRGGKVYSKFKNGTEILIRNNSKPSPTKNKPRKTIKINRNIPITKQNALKLLNSRKNNLSVKEYNNLKNQLNSKINLKPAVLAGVPRIKLYKYSATQNGKLVGFAVVQNRFSNKIRNLHLIVTQRGVGRELFNKIVKNARTNNRNSISLQAVKSAVPSYKKWGFNNKGNAGNYQIMNYSLKNNR